MKPRQWYSTVGQARKDGWPDELDGAELKVANYNLLGDLAALMLQADPSRDLVEVQSAAIGAFRKQCEVVDGVWRPVRVFTLTSGVSFPNPRAPQV